MNQKIKEASEAALAVLQPSNKDLEHGIELHKKSIVIDSYGFAPSGGINTDRCVKLYEDGATRLEVTDANEREFMTGWAIDKELRAEGLAAWREAGVTCIFANTGQEESTIERTIKRMANRTHNIDLLKSDLVKASYPSDITAAKKEGKLAITLTSNSIPVKAPYITSEGMLTDIQPMYDLGCRMMHLTYNRRNLIADGCAEKADSGLSDFGMQTVKEMNRIGIIIDVAHTGWQSSLEAAKFSEKPIVASHSGCAALNNHFRMKPDNVIKAIADNRGVIGVVCVSTFLGGKGDINALLDHIDHVVKVAGVDYVAIGTDQGYCCEKMAEELAAVPAAPEGFSWYRQLWPGGTAGVKEGELRKKGGLLWTNWKYFTVGLVQRGYSDEDIQK
ncbi:MAG: dipeptidase, partial [Planctomycetota bacterium]